LNGIALVRDRQHCDNTTDVDHAISHCHSSQIYKNVLDDRAHTVFQGRVHVAPDAQKTDAHQMNRNLLLSRNAQADSKPELIIHADDVKCSHGATVGDLDQEALFYLQSRGIDPETARNMMVHAFAAELLEALPEDSIRPYLENAMSSWLENIASVEEAA
jgi:Fe-S cluster assembly protein SufD